MTLARIIFRLLALLAALSLSLCFLPSCVAGKGEGWSAIAIATDASKLDIGPDGIHASDLKQSPGAKELGKQIIRNALIGAAAAPIANGVGGAIKNVTKP